MLLGCVIEIVARQGSSDGFGVLFEEHLEVAGKGIFHLVAFYTDDVARGDGFLSHGGGNDVVGADQLGCGFDVIVDECDGFAVVLHECFDGFGVLVDEISASDYDAGDERTCVGIGLKGVPFFR